MSNDISDVAVLRIFAREWLAEWPKCKAPSAERYAPGGSFIPCGRYAVGFVWLLTGGTSRCHVCARCAEKVAKENSYGMPSWERLGGVATMRKVRRWVRMTKPVAK